MELPASEINYWKAYYAIYPFPQEREDVRTALIAQTIANFSGKYLKQDLPLGHFLPDYLGQRDREQAQIDAEKAFAQKALDSGFGVKG